MNSKSVKNTEKDERPFLTPSLKSKYLLLTAFESAKREIDFLTKNKPGSRNSPKPKSQNNLELRKIQRNERLQKLKEEANRKERKAFQLYKLQTSKTNPDEIRYDRKNYSVNSISDKQSNAKLYKLQIEEQENEYYQGIREKLDDRMKKSSMNYSYLLQKKKELGCINRERAHSVNRVYECLENKERNGILKIIAKRQNSEQRKQNFLEQLNVKLKREHDKKEKKITSAQEYVKKQEKIILKRSVELEKRLNHYNSIAFNQKRELSNRIKAKVEKDKLKEDLTMRNYEQQRIHQ